MQNLSIMIFIAKHDTHICTLSSLSHRKCEPATATKKSISALSLAHVWYSIKAIQIEKPWRSWEDQPHTQYYTIVCCSNIFMVITSSSYVFVPHFPPQTGQVQPACTSPPLPPICVCCILSWGDYTTFYCSLGLGLGLEAFSGQLPYNLNRNRQKQQKEVYGFVTCIRLHSLSVSLLVLPARFYCI